MDLKQLLNPILGSESFDYQGSRRSPAVPSPVPSVTTYRRQKVPKDAPIFTEGNRTVGHVNFRPHETADDSELVACHHRFSVYPLGEIEKKGIRHIPYNSDKKDFLDKTGRDAFEVFQYTYKRPGEDKVYTVVWDYNIGLVRMTPFFKSCKYTKTIPAKALRENAGLKEISYSITGGALVCQGYWMPFHAARAVAATFCWDIRWALTPVFGNDFVDNCRRPDHPSYANFKIDPDIVRFCAIETEKFRTQGSSYRITPEDTVLTYMRPTNQLSSPPLSARGSRQRQARKAAMTMNLDENGYGTDTERSDSYLMSPEISPRTHTMSRTGSPHSRPVPVYSRFTPVNRACSPARSSAAMCFSKAMTCVNKRTVALSHAVDLPCSTALEQYQIPRAKRTHSRIAVADESVDESTTGRLPANNDTIRYDSGQECEEPVDESCPSGSDLAAAETLLWLSGSIKLPPMKRSRRESIR